MAPVIGTGDKVSLILLHIVGREVLVCASHIFSFDFCLDGPEGILLYHPDVASLFFGLYEPGPMRKKVCIDTNVGGYISAH